MTLMDDAGRLERAHQLELDVVGSEAHGPHAADA